jgi:hypothetical protein
MPNIKQTFSLPTPFEQQVAEANRRQKLAELMQQEASTPLESQMVSGRVVPTSPLLALSKMLQGYMGGKFASQADEQRAAAEQTDKASAMDFYNNLTQGKQTQVSPDQAMEASMSPTPTEFPARQAAPTGQARESALMQGMIGGGKRTQQLAQLMLAQKPERRMTAAPFKPEDFTPGSFAAALETDDPSLLRAVQKEVKPERPTVSGGTWLNPDTGKWEDIPGYAAQQGAIAAAGRGPEPLVQIMVNGKPVLVPRSQAVGREAFNPASMRQELQDVEKERQKNQTAISTQDTLDTGASLLSHPGRKNATGASHYLSLIPGTDAKDFAVKLDTFKSQTFIPMVSALKGMGALSDAEGKKLSAAVGALDPSMSEKSFKEELSHVIDYLYRKGAANGLNLVRPENLVTNGTSGAWSSNNDLHSQADAVLRGSRAGGK